MVRSLVNRRPIRCEMKTVSHKRGLAHPFLRYCKDLTLALSAPLCMVFFAHSQVEPTQVALEPFLHGHAAIASILIELPRSETGYSPIGQSGLCIGSTLVTHRNPRIILNAPQQLCIFRERRKRHHQTPVNV